VRGRLPIGRGSTILLVYLAFFVSVIGLAFIVVPAAIDQGEEVVAGLPAFFTSAQDWAATLRPEILASSVSSLLGSLAAVATPGAPPDPNEVAKVGTLAAEAAITLATLLTIVFFWLVEHARWQRYVLAYVPVE